MKRKEKLHTVFDADRVNAVAETISLELEDAGRADVLRAAMNIGLVELFNLSSEMDSEELEQLVVRHQKLNRAVYNQIMGIKNESN